MGGECSERTSDGGLGIDEGGDGGCWADEDRETVLVTG